MTRTDEIVRRAIARIQEVLGPAWEPIADRVTHQVSSQSVIAAKVRAEPGLIARPEYQAIRRRNVEALAGNINFNQPIGLELARRAAEAAWSSLEGAAIGGV